MEHARLHVGRYPVPLHTYDLRAPALNFIRAWGEQFVIHTLDHLPDMAVSDDLI